MRRVEKIPESVFGLESSSSVDTNRFYSILLDAKTASVSENMCDITEKLLHAEKENAKSALEQLWNLKKNLLSQNAGTLDMVINFYQDKIDILRNKEEYIKKISKDSRSLLEEKRKRDEEIATVKQQIDDCTKEMTELKQKLDKLKVKEQELDLIDEQLKKELNSNENEIVNGLYEIILSQQERENELRKLRQQGAPLLDTNMNFAADIKAIEAHKELVASESDDSMEQPFIRPEDIISSGTPIEPASLGRHIEPVSLGRHIEPVSLGKHIEPASSEKFIEPDLLRKNIEPALSGRNIEPALSGRNIEPALSGRNIEPALSGRNIEPASLGKIIEPALSGKQIEPASLYKPLDQNNDLGNPVIPDPVFPKSVVKTTNGRVIGEYYYDGKVYKNERHYIFNSKFFSERLSGNVKFLKQKFDQTVYSEVIQMIHQAYKRSVENKNFHFEVSTNEILNDKTLKQLWQNAKIRNIEEVERFCARLKAKIEALGNNYKAMLQEQMKRCIG